MRFMHACLLAVGLTTIVAGQDAEVASLVASARQALGGDAALAAITSFTVDGSLQRSVAQMASTERFQISCLLPDRLLRESRMPMGLQRPDPSMAPVIVASVDVTGVLMPLATFDGTSWKNDWPFFDVASDVQSEREAAARVKTPLAWTSGVPLPNAWNLWEWGGSPRMLNPHEIARPVQNRCGSVWAMRTDFSPRPSTRPWSSDGCPTPIAGVALSDGRQLLEMPAFETRSVPTAEIARSFEQIEAREIKKQASDPDWTDRVHLSLGHPIAPAERQGRRITIDVAYRIALGRTSLIYVEAHREYKRPPTFNDPGCNAVSWLRTWLRVEAAGTVTAISPEIKLNDCDRKGIDNFKPLGVLLMGGVPHVIVEIGEWESQEVGVVRVTASEAKLLVHGFTR